jgi:hypothetical protein
MSLALNELQKVALYFHSNSNSNTTFEHAPQVETIYGYCMQNNQWEIMGASNPNPW